MKVLLLNGSPHREGCTHTALREVEGRLHAHGIETELWWLGVKPVHGCIDCRKCAETGRCAFTDDAANDCIARAKEADGLVIGSPVYYAGPNGALCALLDRMFYAAGGTMAGKPAAAVVSCRRGGASAAFDRLNKYFTISHMPVVPSQYWNSVHGFTPDDVRRDEEGLQVMRALGDNMAWMLEGLAGRELPGREARIMTNFIR